MNEPRPLARVLLTGGAGFIGSHVVDRLMADGVAVTVYDNLSSGKRQWIARYEGQPGFRLVEADLLDRDALATAMPGHDLVWHLGANTDIPAGVSNTRLDLDHCVIATYNVLDVMRECGVRNILFASSGTVYGELAESAMSERAGPMLPISLYGAGKLADEAFISAYCHLFDLRGLIFRFGNVIGARMGHGVIFDFINKLRRNPRELEILGDGRQEKNYFLAEDCVDGMLYAYRNAPLDTARPCDVFNLGAETTTRVTRIADIVLEEMGLTQAAIRFTGGERGWPGDQPRVFMDFGKIHGLGWRASRASDDAVRVAVRRMLDQAHDG